MAAKRNFDLNKKSARSFDLGKETSSRKFDLSKDVDNDAVEPQTVTPPMAVEEPIIDTENLKPTIEGANNGSKPAKSKSAKWIWILIILAFLAILLLLLIPKNQKEGLDDETPIVEQTEEASQDAIVNYEEADTPITPQGQKTNDAQESTMKVGDGTSSNTPTPTTYDVEDAHNNPPASNDANGNHESERVQTVSEESKTNVSDDIEAEALNVIRGKYGNNPVRKEILGSRYSEIQNRVNEILQ